VWIAAEPGDAPGPERVSIALAETAAKGAPASVVFATHVDTSTGVRVDAEGIARVANANGALVVLDGVCAIGGERLEMEKWGVDVALTASQKAIGLPPGLALLVASPAALERRARLRQVPGLALDFDAWRPIMEAYEARKPSYFATPATPLVAALAVGLAELLAADRDPGKAMEIRFEEHARAASAVRVALASFGVDFVPRSAALQANTLTACWHPEGVGPELVGAIAQQGVIVAGGLHPAIRQKTFRIGHMGHSSRTPEHVLRTVDAVGAALIAAGKPVDVAAARTLAEEKLRR
jgi:alanine-glyoxylate transaminase / serine-glyoxylate transaminase / serine-pyruvate transaminase